MVQRLKVTQLYLAPTSLRLLLKCGDNYVHKYNRSSLRILGCGLLFIYVLVCGLFISYCFSTVGEPLNDEAWKWYHTVVGEERCTVVDTWWQTGLVPPSLSQSTCLSSSSSSRDWWHHDHSSSLLHQYHPEAWLPHVTLLWN